MEPGRLDIARRSLDADPFSVDALVEAELQQMKFEIVAGNCWVLLDLKGSLHIQEGNTAVLAAWRTSAVRWKSGPDSGRGHDRRWTAYPIGASSVERTARGLDFRIAMIDGEELLVTCGAVEFWVGDVPGADDPQPDYTAETDEQIRRKLPTWTSEFKPYAVRCLG